MTDLPRPFTRSIARWLALPLLFAAITVPSCAPQNFRESVPWQVREHRASDASTQSVKDMPFLRVDEYLLDRLRSLQRSPDPDGPARLMALVQQSHKLALESSASEIDRLPSEVIDELWTHYCADKAPGSDRRSAVQSCYANMLNGEYTQYLATLGDLHTPAEVSRVAESICDRASTAIADQRGSGLLLDWVRARHSIKPDPANTGGRQVTIYDPAPFSPPTTATARGNESDRELLARFSPILVQERGLSPSYPPRDDEIGAVFLEKAGKSLRVRVSTSEPTIYAYRRATIVHEREHTQLVYCWWFPERPALRPFDPEAGQIDGSTLRITLDSGGRPAIVEAIENCGCYYLCLVSDRLLRAAEPGTPRESAARRSESGAALPNQPAGAFSPSADPVQRPLVFSRAGNHHVTSVAFDPRLLQDNRIPSRRTYLLRPYDELENLPTPSGSASMFGPDGLVHNAGRLEGWWLAPTGVRSAGQPRQRGTQLICFDKLSFDDPHLLEKMLKLPEDF